MYALILLLAVTIGPDAWPDAAPDAIVVRAEAVIVKPTSPGWSGLSPLPARDDGGDLGSISKRGSDEPTDAEKDAAYLKENHWRLGPPSCYMLGCTTCPRTWVWDSVNLGQPRSRPNRATAGGQHPGIGQSPALHGSHGEGCRNDAGLCGESAEGSGGTGAGIRMDNAGFSSGCPNGKCGIKLFRRRR